jgi:L-alanine-DL-glutamate epimerase-like enolase superfamily enzyme
MQISAVKSFVGPSAHFFVKVATDAGIYGLGEGGLRRRGRVMTEVVRWFEKALAGEYPL